MADKTNKISMDIDLNIATGYGSISVENTSPSSLLIRISNNHTLREVIRKRSTLESLLQSQFGQLVANSFDTKVMVGDNTVALLEGTRISEAKRFFVGWQYILAKLGI
jgi:hypothetical protein